jgi:hypothetical protein
MFKIPFNEANLHSSTFFIVLKLGSPWTTNRFGSTLETSQIDSAAAQNQTRNVSSFSRYEADAPTTLHDFDVDVVRGGVKDLVTKVDLIEKERY